MSRFGLRTRSGQVNDILEPQKVIATGGTVTDIIQDGIPYRVHTFTGSGNFVVIRGGIVEMLLVGGGGGARQTHSVNEGVGGAGSGGVSVNLLLNNNYIVVDEGTYPIVIGAGGTAGTSPTIGDYSSALGQAAMGGGFGTRAASGPGSTAATSGGWGARATGTTSSIAIAGTFEGYQGFEGGARTVADDTLGSAGGGGAGGGGVDITNTGGGVGFAGGIGYTTTIRGTSETFGTGGQGSTVGQAGVDGGANTGDGARGGGQNATTLAGGTGGSGICIIRYKL